jgi:hypothetical protein
MSAGSFAASFQTNLNVTTSFFDAVQITQTYQIAASMQESGVVGLIEGDQFQLILSATGEGFSTFRGSSNSVDLAWLTAAIDAGRESCSKQILVDLITGLCELLSDQQYSSVDIVLRSLDASRLSPEVLLASTRTSYPVRHKLAAWRPLVIRMRQEFANRHFEADKMLQGLI